MAIDKQQQIAQALAFQQSEKAKLWQKADEAKSPKEGKKERRKNNTMGVVLDAIEEYGLKVDRFGKEIHPDMSRAELDECLHQLVNKIHRWQTTPGDIVEWVGLTGIVCWGILAPGVEPTSFTILYSGEDDSVVQEPIDLKKVALKGIYRIKWPSGAHS